MSRFLVNGSLTDEISIFDRGLHYGDGLFETIAVHQGQPLLWEAHMQRLQIGSQRLGLSMPPGKTLLQEAQDICADLEKSVLKIMYTRGSGGRGYKSPKDIVASRIIGLYDWPDYPPDIRSSGVNVRICNMRMAANPALAGLKHMNRLEQILARNEWQEDSIFEGLLMDMEENVIEGTMSNIFLLQGNTLLTPDLSQCGIQGIIRDVILDAAPDMGFTTKVEKISLQSVLAADEVFISNSIAGLLPVRQIGQTRFTSFDVSHKFCDYLLKENYIAPL